MNEYPQIKRDIVDAEGDMYYVPHFVLTPENNIFKGPLIREDWLVKLGLEVPETVDELYNVLVAFRDGDPNGNNEKDEWAMSGAGAFTSSGAHSPGQLSWAWDTTPSFYLRDGKVQYGPLDPQFKDALAFMNKLYNEGLLDPDYIVMGRSQLDASHGR